MPLCLRKIIGTTNLYALGARSTDAAKSLLEEAAEQEKSRNYREAIAFCREALWQNPLCAAAYHQIGCAMLMLGEVEEAVRNFRAAIELDPSYTEKWLEQTGETYFPVGKGKLDGWCLRQYVAATHPRRGAIVDVDDTDA